jgi:Bacterial regulatory helix-turn-helix protein, lysR family
LRGQGFGPRKIARITGCSERTIRRLLTGAGLRQPAARPHRDIDPDWLREQYQGRCRSLKDIAADTGIPAATLAAVARSAGIPVRHGASGHDHPLASLGGPGAFPPSVWNAFSRPGAEQRIRRLLAAPGHPSLNHAARHLGTRHATLTSQIRQLEAITGTTLLHTHPGAPITLTSEGELFARDALTVLDILHANDTESTWPTSRKMAN